MSKTLPERLRDAARKLRTSSMPLSDYIPLLQQAADYIEAQGVPDVDSLTDAIAEGLRGTYHCTRVWEAWHVGTMDQDDFEPVDESDTPRELAETVIAMLAAAPPAPQPQPVRCKYCDGAGDVHSITGEWRGACVCEAGKAPQPQPVQEPVVWLPIETAPKDSSMLRLLVNFDDHSLEDCSEPCWTIGTNALSDTGVDEWLFAGWDWTHDRFTQGTGTPIGWLPMLYTSPQAVQPQPLSDGQINQMWSDAHNDTSPMSMIHVLARAIEAAHGITKGTT